MYIIYPICHRYVDYAIGFSDIADMYIILSIFSDMYIILSIFSDM